MVQPSTPIAALWLGHTCPFELFQVHVTAQTTRGRYVTVTRVIHDHTVRTESPRQRADRIHHHLDPALWQPIDVAIVEQGRDLVFQQVVEVLRVSIVSDDVVCVLGAFADGETILACPECGGPVVSAGLSGAGQD